MSVELTDVKNILEKTSLMSISTVALDGRPQAAIIEFASTPEFEIIFDTHNTSRKYTNLKQDARVALVIGWDDNITLQYEGVAEELSGEHLAQHKTIYFKKNPKAKKWENATGITFLKVSPKWIRYSDLNTNPWTVKEFTF